MLNLPPYSITLYSLVVVVIIIILMSIRSVVVVVVAGCVLFTHVFLLRESAREFKSKFKPDIRCWNTLLLYTRARTYKTEQPTSAHVKDAHAGTH